VASLRANGFVGFARAAHAGGMGAAQDASPAPCGYLPFAVNDDGSLRATNWKTAVAMRALTNLAPLKADDPIPV
jgi:hypothetical protein